MSNEDKFLGKQTEYKFSYDKSLLNPVPRINERQRIGLGNTDLPFTGVDVWNCYEVSCLTHNGLPVVGIAKIVYPAESSCIIESKSLKLYLNSFNMERIGDPGETDVEVRAKLQTIIANDLSEALSIVVAVRVFNPLERNICNYIFNPAELYDIKELDQDSSLYASSEEFQYTENPELIKFELIKPIQARTRPGTKIFVSNLLRSNCKITKQPDWGTVWIGIKANGNIDESSLLKYIVSFRNENHFHEEVCETIYTRLWNKIHPEELFVSCFYTRRGGIDINPIRVSHAYMIKDYFGTYVSLDYLSHKLSRQ